MSSVPEPQPSPPEAEPPRWRVTLVRWLGPAGFAVALNQLATVLPPVAVGAVLVVVAVVYGFNQLDETAPLAGALPRLLLYVAVVGIALAVTTPPSWTGPLTLVSVVLITCATLVARARATALTSLAGISVFTAGLITVSDAVHVDRVNARILGMVLGGFAVLAGLLILRYRREIFGANGISVADFRGPSLGLARVGAIGVLGVVAGIDLAADGRLLPALLAGLAGSSWLGVTLVLGFVEHPDALAGVLLMIAGASITGLGLLAFHGSEFLVGTIAATGGVAMAGGGVSLLEATGVLARLRTWLAYLVKPAGR
ncbi:hypothetical protein V6V47_25385 [Micromonospora sp. CPCC 205539]|uniref:hypothetical protein n=1 Tax=Micromonospora sp. CPCC 205539 TaxID=3122408 RepID=UPI002FF16185